MVGTAIPAYAKINRDLRIQGRDAAGFHLIATVFETIALHDLVTIRRSFGPLRVTCSDPSLPTDERNLVTRAARGWCDLHRKGDTDGLHVHVVKRIPQQAGLGGGSADAAATLVALAMVDGGFDTAARARGALREAETALAARLGSDVPFFLVGGCALGTGRGDRVRALPDRPVRPVVLARPPFGVATADAYRWFAQAHGLEPGRMRQRDASIHAGCVNDLEAPVAQRHPEIAGYVAELRRAGARQAAMTGSGSVVFGVFDRRADASVAGAALHALGATVWETSTLPRALAWGGDE